MRATNEIIRAQVNFQAIGSGCRAHRRDPYVGPVLERERMTRAQCRGGRRARSESGMTLVEVVISVVLLSMITGAVGAAFITGFNGVRPSQQRVRESNDAQVIASFLVRDAQSAGGSNPNTGTGDASLGVSSPGTAPDCTGPSGTDGHAVRRGASSRLRRPRSCTSRTTTSTRPRTRSYARRASTARRSRRLNSPASSRPIDDGHGNSNRASCIAANGSEAPCPTSPAATLPDRVRVHITETNDGERADALRATR